MALLDINWNPDRRQLRVFLALLLLFGAIAALVVQHRTGSQAASIAVAAAALLIAGAGFLVPRVARGVYVAWMLLALPIGWTVSHVVLALVYYLVLTPVGVAMRLLGRDPLHRKFDPAAKSYWLDHRQTKDVSRYFRQF